MLEAKKQINYLMRLISHIQIGEIKDERRKNYQEIPKP